MQDTSAQVWEILATVCDPEVPVLTVLDLGIVRDVKISDGAALEIVITPTYSGCPAMNTIEVNIRAALQDAGFDQVAVTTIFSPAWTTDWLTESGKEKLKAYGIAPPVGRASEDKNILFGEEKNIACPQCNSTNSRLLSQFGSTACKSLYQCQDCREPFDYFKCH